MSLIEEGQPLNGNKFEKYLLEGFDLHTCLASLSLSIFLAALDIMTSSIIIENAFTQFGE